MRREAGVEAVAAAGGEAVVLRRASGADARAGADVWLRSFAVALPTVARPRTDAEVREYFRHVLVPRHGFTAVEWSDGARNEEREPDVRYVWRPQ
ncbi:hypothetical protein [Streptomyces sp. AC512_CC834]|uniref:hypothetical protein n=1 Tax=Streptomyces sp. AC512_CC834 TaxID=2823691 RepID=UPI001C2673CB|nr:hypothetical protein [Streptomyces sp. AC512_CC834]